MHTGRRGKHMKIVVTGCTACKKQSHPCDLKKKADVKIQCLILDVRNWKVYKTLGTPALLYFN